MNFDTSTMPHTHISLLQQQAALFAAAAIQCRLNALDAINRADREISAKSANLHSANAQQIYAFVRRTMGIEK